MSYENTIAYLYGLQSHGIKLGLDNPRELLRRAGNPEQTFRSIHLAGTNGKGSTAAMLSSILQKAGHRTGLFTSPHLVSFTERIRIGGSEITEAEVVALAEEVRALSEGLEPTFFEVVTVMGFLHFQRKGVAWAVVETGMGGRLDATNCLSPDVCVITPIGLDHREFLGESIAEIAREKAGIIKTRVPVVAAAQEQEALQVIRDIARERNAPLYVEGEQFATRIREKGVGRMLFDYWSEATEANSLEINLSGTYQASNASLAIKAFELTSPGADDVLSIVRSGLLSLVWPGRMELVAQDPLTYVDGAHNPRAAEALARMLEEDFLNGGKKLTLLMGDKDIEGIISPLVSLASRVVFAAPAYGRSAPVERLFEVARKLGTSAEKASSVAEGLQLARSYGDMVLVTGSFYTIGEAKEALGSTGFLSKLREWQGAP